MTTPTGPEPKWKCPVCDSTKGLTTVDRSCRDCGTCFLVDGPDGHPTGLSQKQAERIAELEAELAEWRLYELRSDRIAELERINSAQAERVKELERALVTMANWDNDKAFGGYDQETALHLSDVLLSARRAIGGEQEEGKG